MSKFDAVVIGAGTGGLSAALSLANAGKKVLLLEKAPEGKAGGNSVICIQWICGTSDKAAYLAKRALLRTVGEHNADPLYADMEQRILDKVNASGVGPQGLGGTVTALSCAIEPFGTHIAGLPCVVNISCHVTRHAEGEI